MLGVWVWSLARELMLRGTVKKGKKKSYIIEENWSAISTKWNSERTGKEKAQLAFS